MPDFMTDEETRAVETYLRKKRATMCPTVYVAAVTGAEPVVADIKEPKSRRKVGMQIHNQRRRENAQARADMYAASLGPGMWSTQQTTELATSLGVDPQSVRKTLRDNGYGNRIIPYTNRRKEG